MLKFRPFLKILVTLTITTFTAQAFSFGNDLLQKLSRQAPALDKNVLKNALDSMECAVLRGVAVPENLAIIDFRLPSNQNRLWIFNLQQETLTLKELVAHGKNSGSLSATSFSNQRGSLQSSLGLFRGQETYQGKHGYSLRLDGLEPGINDNARDRAIVIHGAGYVDQSWIKKHGRLGRSFGCPAVREEIAQDVVDSLKDGQLIFSFYPDKQWLENSSFLNCAENKVTAIDKPAAKKQIKNKRTFNRFVKG